MNCSELKHDDIYTYNELNYIYKLINKNLGDKKYIDYISLLKYNYNENRIFKR